MNDFSIDDFKKIDLVEFLSKHYGLEFKQQGAAFVCRSPFSNEKNPSFFVQLVDGHWLFNDFSSNLGGTIFDFVQLKEKLPGFTAALLFLRKLFSGVISDLPVFDNSVKDTGAEANGRSYDIDNLYKRFKEEDPNVCREYLIKRGIFPELVDALIYDGIVVHNRYKGRSWCCFAVRDRAGNLKCLDNHSVDGNGKFVLGQKSIFSYEWEALKQSKVVFLTEGIIDYLSIKTLELNPPPGIALLGNQLNFEPDLFYHTDKIISALDTDDGGLGAFLDLQHMYPDKTLKVYNLENCKDPNEMLISIKSKKGHNLSSENKLKLYREFQKTDNKTELASRWNIDRSYLYRIIKNCDEILFQGICEQKPGRPPKGEPVNLQEATERIRELEMQYEKAATEREKLYCKSEFLELRLKWSEIEAAELKGENVDKGKKKHVKKKEKEEIVMKIKELNTDCSYLNKNIIIEQSNFSQSQLNKWKNGLQLDRKKREPKLIPEKTVENTVEVVVGYPQFSGRKGQDFMLYHQLGYIGEKKYDNVKKDMRRLFMQEISRRNLYPERSFYEHICPEKVGEIWAEDFTDLIVEGHKFKLALLLDVYDHYYLGAAVAQRATAAFVNQPVDQALTSTGHKGPTRFLLSDNGSQYISEDHCKLLTSREIIQRRIPACVPQYNGSAEGGMRNFKSVFYNVWVTLKKEEAAKEKSLLDQVQTAVKKTLSMVNDVIPRPCLGGVTPADVHFGRKEQRLKEIQEYREIEENRRDVPPWKNKYWNILKSGLNLEQLSDSEVLTKTAFFCRMPLRRIAKRNQECVD